MSSSQITLTISIVMIALFSIAIVGFTIGFANDTGAEVSVLDDPEERLSGLYEETTLATESFRENSEGTYTSILDSTVEPGSDVVQSAAPFAITPTNLVDVAKSIISVPRDVIFGGSGSQFGFVFTAFITFLVFIFALLLYKTLRGNP